jgi:hypothetical protein
MLSWLILYIVSLAIRFHAPTPNVEHRAKVMPGERWQRYISFLDLRYRSPTSS